MKYIYLSALLLSVSAFNLSAAWDGTAAQWTAGTGSETDPYIIGTEQHLAYLQKTVNEGETYEGKFFRLAANLDMSGKTMNPIGFHDDYSNENNWVEASKPFLGSFDGAYFTIDNVTIELAEDDTDEIGGIGLFALGRKSTVVKNLRLGNKVTIEAKGSPDTGGIMGISYGATIENCSFAGTVNGGPGAMEIGGIVGYAVNGSVIKGCINTGNIIANSFTGGIVGSTDNTKVSDCLHMGSVDGNQGSWVAGIIGWALRTELTTSVSLGVVFGPEGSLFMPGKSPVCAELENSTATACYYVKDLTECDPASAQEGVTSVSEEVMKSAETLKALNGGNDEGAWVAGAEGDYPTLAWTLKSTSGIAPVVAAAAADVKVVGASVVITAANASYTIADVAGRVIASGNVDGEACITPAANGLYIVVVRAADGTSTVTKLQL